MKKGIIIFVGASSLLIGCQNKGTVVDNSTTTTSVAETTKENINYFQYFVDKYQKAVEFSKNHQNVQTPLAALVEAYDELKHRYSSDVQMINRNYEDLQTLLNWDSDAWKKIFTQWADGINQKYEQIDHEDFDKQNSLIPSLKNMTVSNKKVNWNVFGVTETNNYDYLILDVYQDTQDKHLYLFTFQSGQPVVLYINTTLEQLGNGNFEPTQNTELTKAFSEFFSPTVRSENSTTDLSKRIDTIMKTYTSDDGKIYLVASPATQRDYYGLASPDQVFQYGKVNGNHVIFKWNDWVVGDSGDTYDIQACYVNDSGTEVILFCYKDGKPLILHTVGKPVVQKSVTGAVESATVNFEELDNSVLKSAFNE